MDCTPILPVKVSAVVQLPITKTVTLMIQVSKALLYQIQGQGNAMGIGRTASTGGNFPMTTMQPTMSSSPFMGGSPSSKSQFVKQELRDSIVSRRMPQTSQSSNTVHPIPDQMIGFEAALKADDTSGDLPADLFDESKLPL